MNKVVFQWFSRKLFLAKITQGDCKVCERLQKLIAKKGTGTENLNARYYKGELKITFRTLREYRECFICAHIRKTFNILKFLQSLFVFSVSNWWRSQALVEHNRHLSQSPTRESQRGEVWRSGRPGNGSPSAEPWLRQLPIQECCQPTVDVWWFCVMFRQCLQLWATGRMEHEHNLGGRGGKPLLKMVGASRTSSWCVPSNKWSTRWVPRV